MHPHQDGLLCVWAVALGPDVQILAVLVLQPVAMRKNEFVGAWGGHRRNRGNGAPCLRILDTFPGLYGLRQLEAVRLGVADAEEGLGLAVSKASKFSTFHLHDGRVQI